MGEVRARGPLPPVLGRSPPAGGWLQILQTAVAAAVAWALAVLILGLERPTFAPIVAVIALGPAVSECGRRAVELTLGVAFGVAIADLLVSIFGVGRCRPGLWW